jgi:hypothetical protein
MHHEKEFSSVQLGFQIGRLWNMNMLIAACESQHKDPINYYVTVDGILKLLINRLFQLRSFIIGLFFFLVVFGLL